MGWANCGEDSAGRPIGYAHDAVCDEPGCTKEINRGLSYACGGEHGDGEHFCEKYFCHAHQIWCVVDGKSVALCPSCAALVPDEEEADVDV